MTPATTQSTDAHTWAVESRRWGRFYVNRLPEQLRLAAALADETTTNKLRPHFDTFLALLNAAPHAALAPLWLDLVDRLHPHPLRWGEWSAWLAILQQAGLKAAALGRPAQQAEYLAYTAGLLLNTGRLEAALAAAQRALALARPSGAAWPLCVAGSAAAATLRAMAHYEDAQALIDELRDELTLLEPARPPARAAMAAALLDLEQMDLLRHFARPEEAMALGETLINNLSAVTDIDLHDLATAYVRRATITWAFDRYDQAADDLRRAADLYRQAGDGLQAAFAEGNLGVVYLSMSRYAEAKALKLAAMAAAEEVNARHVLVSELGDLSVIYIGLGQMEQAYEYADRMVRLAAELGNDAELARGRGNRAYTLLALERQEEARLDFEFSLNHYRQQGRVEGTLITTIDKVMYLRSIGQVEEAERVARENYAAALKLDYPKLHIVTGRCLALFLPPDEQRTLLEQTLALARAHGRLMDEAGCLFSLATMADNTVTRDACFRQAQALLAVMGCPQWLAGRSVDNPPLLPMMI
ncbi:MAG: tetratricopeptide repeat protein [Anaerolineae bacterium]|nr:tetratricopeptide repeat protein [Anaerolineae bacterium]